MTNIAFLTGTNQTTTGNQFLPKTAESSSYDLDGNLTSDGRWTNNWDAENWLVEYAPSGQTIPASGTTATMNSVRFS